MNQTIHVHDVVYSCLSCNRYCPEDGITAPPGFACDCDQIDTMEKFLACCEFFSTIDTVRTNLLLQIAPTRIGTSVPQDIKIVLVLSVVLPGGTHVIMNTNTTIVTIVISPGRYQEGTGKTLSHGMIRMIGTLFMLIRFINKLSKRLNFCLHNCRANFTSPGGC